MSLIRISTIVFCLIFSLALHANASFPDTAIVRVFGGPGTDKLYSLKPLPDSTLILVGTTNYFGPGGNSVYVIRTDKNGNHIWSKVFGKSQVEQGYDVTVAGDTAIYIVGMSNSAGNGGYDGYVVRIDTSGNRIWEKEFGGSDWDFFYSSCMLNDGSLVLCGETYSFTNGGKDGFVVRIDPDGNQLWSSHVGGPGNEKFNSVCLADNAIFLAGTIVDSGNVNSSGYIVKMDLSGNVQREYRYVSEGNDGINSIRSFANSVITCGYSQHPDSSNRNIWWFSADTSGNVITNYFFDSPEDDYLNDAVYAASGYFNFTGQKNPGGLGEKSMFLLRYDVAGSFKAAASFGGILNEEGSKIELLPGNRLGICGYTTSYGAGNEDAYLVVLPQDTLIFEYELNRTNYTEQLSPIGIKEIQLSRTNALYPNPSTGTVFIKSEFANPAQKIVIYSMIGSALYERDLHSGNRLNLPAMLKGSFLYKIYFENGNYIAGRLILQ